MKEQTDGEVEVGTCRLRRPEGEERAAAAAATSGKWTTVLDQHMEDLRWAMSYKF